MPRLSTDDAIDDLCVEETQSATRVGDQTTDQGSSRQSSMATNKINRRRIIETKYTQKEMKSYGKKYLLFTNNILSRMTDDCRHTLTVHNLGRLPAQLRPFSVHVFPVSCTLVPRLMFALRGLGQQDLRDTAGRDTWTCAMWGLELSTILSQ